MKWKVAILGVLLCLASPAGAAWSRIQRVACSTAAAATSYTCSLSSTGANHLIVVSLWSNVAINTPTDNLSTTYQQDFTHGSNQSTYSAVPSSGGITTVTQHLGSAGNSSAFVEEWSGNATASWFDVSASNIGQVASAWTSNTTATLNQTGELAIGYCYDGANATDTNTPSGGFGDGGDSTNTTDGDSLFTENQVMSATTGVAATGTLNATHTLDNWVVTYKPGAGGPPPCSNSVALAGVGCR
jgi:hypothetical protein